MFKKKKIEMCPKSYRKQIKNIFMVLYCEISDFIPPLKRFVFSHALLQLTSSWHSALLLILL